MVINGYNTSNDYEMLFELMHQQRVICYLDFLSSWILCETEIPNYNEEETDKPFRLRNCDPRVVRCTTKEEFIEECRRYKVWFVTPMQSSQTTLAPSLLELFKPMVFETPEALHVKANELNCVPFEGAEDIQYLHHIAGTLYKQGCKLFYFKKAFSERELEHLIYCDDYHEVKDKPNIYINGNHSTGVLYVVENLPKESTK